MIFSHSHSPKMNSVWLHSHYWIRCIFFCVAFILCFSGHSKCLVWAPTSLNRFMKRGPYRHGLCLWHCRELTVIWLARWDATATMNTASYIRAADVCIGGKKHSKIFSEIKFKIFPKMLHDTWICNDMVQSWLWLNCQEDEAERNGFYVLPPKYSRTLCPLSGLKYSWQHSF